MQHKHSLLSPSSAHRWMQCPGSVSLCKDIPIGPASEHAIEGTLAHEYAELILREDEQALIEFEKTHTIPDEMFHKVTEYTDYVQSFKGDLIVEARVDLSEHIPHGYGTADAVILGQDEDEGVITVIDLKYGKGIAVFAENNPQIMIYALGVIAMLEGVYEADTVRLVIHQPRLDTVSEWTIPVSDLLKWAETEVKVKAELALSDNAPLSPSASACQWCAAKAQCPKLAEEMFKTVDADFDGGDLTPTPAELLDNDHIAFVLERKKLIEKWLDAIDKHAYEEMLSGREIPGFKLVAGRSIRKWLNEEDAEQAMRKAKVKVADMFTKKLKSPTQIEKTLGKDHPIMQEHVVKPEGKATIAPVSDKRPALPVFTPEDAFSDVETDEAA